MDSSDRPEPPDPTMSSYNRRLYEYRLRRVTQVDRQLVWNEIARYVHKSMGSPRCVLDAAAGRGEFVNAIEADERWAADAVDYGTSWRDPTVKVVIGDILDIGLPDDHFDGVFVSNFLEHLPDPATITAFLSKMRRCTMPGGRIAVLGPNFRYAFKEYFDCADHLVALTHVALEEHLYATGWTVRKAVPRFIPYSFRSVLPASPLLTRAYLRVPPAWRFLGKQFLVIADRPAAP